MTTNALPPVGSFFATSWGYDQTNVEFYKVVGHTASGKSLRLQRWTAKRAPGRDGGPSAEYLIPGDEPATTPFRDLAALVAGRQAHPVFVHRARLHYGRDGHVTTSIDGHYAGLHRDGEAHYATASGWGH